MKIYKHVFFDLDHTLWDFDRNSSEVLGELYDKYDLHDLGIIDKQIFAETFRTVNNMLWDQYNTGLISKNDIRVKRFPKVFEGLGLENSAVPSGLERDYISACPTKSNLFPHAIEVLHYLSQNYVLHIITNGFEDIQEIKLRSSNIKEFFVEIITSEKAGFRKPHHGMFTFALKKAKASCSECVMIGDDLQIDIVGARNASIDHIYFNPGKLSHSEKVTHEITCLSQLMNIL